MYLRDFLKINPFPCSGLYTSERWELDLIYNWIPGPQMDWTSVCNVTEGLG